jgi:haloalkane dehalogenase
MYLFRVAGSTPTGKDVPMVTEERVHLSGVGISTRVLRSGAGAPVLLLHGSPDSASEWRPVMEALGTTCACLAPDLPGLGACDEPPRTFDYSRAACGAFLDELCSALGVRGQVVVVVHDIGGILGIPWAAKHVERVRGVVITNTVVFEHFPWFPLGRIWGRTDPVGRVAASALMTQFGWLGGRIFRTGFRRISPELSDADLDRMTREFALDDKSKRSTLRIFQRMVPHAYFEGYDAMVRDLIARVPVRVLWGTGDPYIPSRYASAFPGAACEVIERGGHWIPISASPKVAQAIESVLVAAPGEVGRVSGAA